MILAPKAFGSAGSNIDKAVHDNLVLNYRLTGDIILQWSLFEDGAWVFIFFGLLQKRLSVQSLVMIHDHNYRRYKANDLGGGSVTGKRT